MSKVAPFSPYRLEDFPSQREWIDTLFFPLNQTLLEVTAALNGQVTYSDNIPAFTKLLSGTSLTFPQSFKLDGNFIPTQMVVAQAFRAGSPITVMGAWSFSGDTITVSELFEISASGNTPVSSGPKYQINLRFT